MKSNVNDSILTVFLSGRIDSSNAAETEKEMKQIISDNDGCAVVFDAKDLEYISSAGLRSLLKIQKEKGGVKIVNVSRDIYEIFEMTGFTGIMDIHKALREFSVEGLEKVGQGGTAAVYRLDEDKIIKVFKPLFPVNVIQQEKAISQKLFLAGIPTAVPYDVVKCGEENIGVIYEMLNAGSLVDLMTKNEAEASKYAEMMADLLKKTSKIQVEDLNDIKLQMMRVLQLLTRAGIVTAEESEKYKKIFDNIPDSDDFIHGDFHPGNIMMVDGELMLIDLSGAAKGHVIFDLAGVNTYLNCMPSVMKREHYKAFSGLESEHAEKLWEVFRDRFFEGKDEQFIKKAETQIKAISCIRLLGGAATVPDLIQPASVAVLKEYLNDNYDTAVSKIEF